MLTVLFATRDRAGILRNVLESFCHLQPPPSGWKLVVVDNGSTDDTAEVIASFANRLPMRSVLEPKPGKNSALNTGLALVEGDLTVFTDDDVFPREDWLVQLREAADAHPECTMFGGTVVPRWESRPPNWIGWLDLAPIFAVTPSSMREGELPPEQARLIYGPNMAVRTSLFQAGVRFDSSIGPRGDSYAMGSETELLLRISRQGHKAWYVRRATVEHFVRKEQLNKAWILKRAVRFGRGMHRMAPNQKQWMGIPRHLVRDLPKELLIAAACVLFRPDKTFRACWRFNYLRGVAIESLIMHRDHRVRAKPASSMSASRTETGE
jgi:glycosyltransferase involved in cell wall biosynthesis